MSDRWVRDSGPEKAALAGRRFIEQGKQIIVSTVQKFPFILDEIATEGGKSFAIVIDEAHSSQGGKTSAAMSQALGAAAEDEDAGPDPEDTVNAAVVSASGTAVAAVKCLSARLAAGRPAPEGFICRARSSQFHAPPACRASRPSG